MPFIRLKGVDGWVFEPEMEGSDKKHPCPDCADCQWCSDSRCKICRRDCRKSRTRRKRGQP